MPGGEAPLEEGDVVGGVMARDGIGRDSIFRFDVLRLIASAVLSDRGEGGAACEVRDLS